MSLTIRQGEHVLSPAEGGSALPDSLDITGDAVVHVHRPLRSLFVFQRATVHLHAPVGEVWVHTPTTEHKSGPAAEVHVHVPCRINVSGRAHVHIYVAGGYVIATQRGKVHVHTPEGRGVPVSFYDDAEIWAGTGPEVVRNSPYAVHHRPDGTTTGEPGAYRGGVWRRQYQ
jgi:hypothetical protein